MLELPLKGVSGLLLTKYDTSKFFGKELEHLEELRKKV